MMCFHATRNMGQDATRILTIVHRSIKTSSKHRKERSQSSYKFVDNARIRVTGGSGGKGCVSFHQLGSYKQVPDGGHGGNGGSVVLVADKSLQTLNMSKHHHAAKPGTHGSSSTMHGRRGENSVLKVPCGVVVKRILDLDERWDVKNKRVASYREESVHSDEEVLWGNDSGNEYNSVSSRLEREEVILADLDAHGSHLVIAYGGRGGTGNCTVSGRNYDPVYARNAGRRSIPEQGEAVFLELELKLIADIGFVGYPNAGKSSLLAAMSRASPEIAPYPFTTLHPLIGSIEFKDGFRILAADVPGLIEGASSGRGRGFDFLRHLERTKALMYMVDAAGVDGRCPIQDFQVLVGELGAYAEGSLLERPALVVLNKLDLLQDLEEMNEIILGLQEIAEESGLVLGDDVIGISTKTGQGLHELSRVMRLTVEQGEKVREATNLLSS